MTIHKQRLDRVIVILVLVNLVAAVLAFVWLAGTPPSGPPGPTSSSGVAPPASPGIPLPSGPGADLPMTMPATPVVMSVGTPDPAVLARLDLIELYWSLERIQELGETSYSADQPAEFLRVLKQAKDENWSADRERTELLGRLQPIQQAGVTSWHNRSLKWSPPARTAMYAQRDDLIAFFSKPLPKPLGDQSPDGPDQPRLAIPYYELLWGVAEVDRNSGMPLNAEQARFIGAVVDELLGIFSRLQNVYTSAVHVLRQELRPDQVAYIQAHSIPIERYSREFIDIVPKDADVVGYLAARIMARRTGVSVCSIPAPRILDLPVDPSPSADKKPDPEYYFAGILQLEQEPKLALTPAQCTTLMPYVKGVADENYHSHMVKEQIGDRLTKKQRLWVLDYLQQHRQRRPAILPGPSDVIRQMRVRASAASGQP